tara:strand:+ start:897 stop:1301 length:405 start_codon:yes stop_codon:yes gene_type:complete
MGLNGLHLIVDAKATKGLHDRECVEDWIRQVVRLSGMTLLGMQSHLLPTSLDSGPGVSVVAVIAESHVSVHTWPEHNMITMDFYSCKSYYARTVLESFNNTFGVTEHIKYRAISRWGKETEEGHVATADKIVTS